MLTLENICVTYGKRQILSDVSFSLIPHKFTAVLGKNGSGKSTLVSCINQVARYTGEITTGGKNIALMPARERAQTIAILPQILASPHITVRELVELGRNPYVDIARRFSSTDKAAVAEAIDITGIEALSDCYIDEISGGERQKAYLAMIFAQAARVIVLDEPTTYLDTEYESNVLKLLNEMKSVHKKTLLVILHNINAAVTFADRIVVLDKNTVCFAGTRDDCLARGVLESVFHVRRHETDDGGCFFTAW